MLLRFFRELEGKADELYILGDLFDFWLGFPVNPFRQYDDVLAALQSLVSSGCRLIYFEGNHDFHLGPIFSRQLGAEIHRGPAVLELQGRRICLCHGDQINRNDYGYRLLRLLLHNQVTAAAVNHVSPKLAMSIRDILQRRSRAGYGSKARKWHYPEIIREYARSQSSQGCDALITGHFHCSMFEQLSEPAITVLSLGDWIEQFTYGVLENGELRLSTYPA